MNDKFVWRPLELRQTGYWHGASCVTDYYDVPDESKRCVLLVDGQLYVSPVFELTEVRDTGPYETLEQAQRAAEMLMLSGVLD